MAEFPKSIARSETNSVKNPTQTIFTAILITSESTPIEELKFE